MTTDPRALSGLLPPLRGYLDRITERADAQARTAGLTVEKLPGGVRHYHDPRFDEPDQLAADRAAACRPYADVRTRDSAVAGTAWSTPVLTVSASGAGAGWSQ